MYHQVEWKLRSKNTLLREKPTPNVILSANQIKRPGTEPVIKLPELWNSQALNNCSLIQVLQ